MVSPLGIGKFPPVLKIRGLLHRGETQEKKGKLEQQEKQQMRENDESSWPVIIIETTRRTSSSLILTPCQSENPSLDPGIENCKNSFKQISAWNIVLRNTIFNYLKKLNYKDIKYKITWVMRPLCKDKEFPNPWFSFLLF